MIKKALKIEGREFGTKKIDRRISRLVKEFKKIDRKKTERWKIVGRKKDGSKKMETR